ncbi:MAG: acetylxylan esterase [Planctomycetia bacterium]|nr:acetylxylan esterase [Planctomycetia bacterium]
MFAFVLIAASSSLAQPSGFNYDESKVPTFTLPDPLVLTNGEKVADTKTWQEKRRPEIMKLFEEQVYGRSPQPRDDMSFEMTSVDKQALGGKAIRKEVTIYFSDDKAGPRMSVLIYLPAAAKGPTPAFVGYNFNGNHTVHSDPGITLSKAWMRKNDGRGVVDNRATEESRGTSSSRWAIDMILDRGYGLATVYYGDVDPDFDDDFQNGIHPLFNKPGQKKPAADEWGSIAAWAWGLSRAMDYFETDKDIDSKHVAVMGHSRLGKTSLWAGATDERFAITISNDSGCGGAALSRRRFGETVARINTSFPHWFCDNFVKYNDKEDELPVDQHMLIALIAPRPVYIASAVEDKWADPRGEFLSGYYAHPVYRLLGTSGIGTDEMPQVDKPVMNTIGYHIRSGGHDVTDFDWKAYLDFADKHFRGK